MRWFDSETVVFSVDDLISCGSSCPASIQTANTTIPVETPFLPWPRTISARTLPGNEAGKVSVGTVKGELADERHTTDGRVAHADQNGMDLLVATSAECQPRHDFRPPMAPRPRRSVRSSQAWIVGAGGAAFSSPKDAQRIAWTGSVPASTIWVGVSTGCSYSSKACRSVQAANGLPGGVT